MSSPLTVSVAPSYKGISEEFKTCAGRGQHTEAVAKLQNLPVFDGLVSCLELAKANRSAFDSLEGMGGIGRAAFCLRLVRDGSIPPAIYTNVLDNDYDEARRFILQVRADPKNTSITQQIWRDAKTIAQERPFYPEIIRSYNDIRDRVCKIARSHVDLEPGKDPRQIALFSLGGMFNWEEAKKSSTPKIGTTCILFLRGVLHAAGWNVIMDRNPNITDSGTATNVPLGLGNLPLNKEAIVLGSQLDKGLVPRHGDFFHKEGKPWIRTKSDGTKELVYSVHVGIIVMRVLLDPWNEGQYWNVAEGGQDKQGWWTRYHPKTLTKVAPVEVGRIYNHWAFEDDQARPIQKWYDLERLTNRWMNLNL